MQKNRLKPINIAFAFMIMVTSVLSATVAILTLSALLPGIDVSWSTVGWSVVAFLVAGAITVALNEPHSRAQQHHPA